MRIRVNVTPRAKKAEITAVRRDFLKIKVNAPPIHNKANEELIRLLADYYRVKKSAITIVRGVQSREKVVDVLLP